jgi:hypothetical protein
MSIRSQICLFSTYIALSHIILKASETMELFSTMPDSTPTALVLVFSILTSPYFLFRSRHRFPEKQTPTPEEIVHTPIPYLDAVIE